MASFQGFSGTETFTRVPDTFFRKLLKEIEDLDELKVTLYALWRMEHMEDRIHFLKQEDFAACTAHAGAALERAVQRGSLLVVRRESETLYFLNSPRGQAAARAFTSGQLKLSSDAAAAAEPLERPNIFRLYEENIGPLTPLLADALKDAEKTYPPEWVEAAIGEAVKNNKRSWKYVEAILRRWKEEGHAEKQDRRDAKETRGRDVTRKVEDFFKR